MRAARTARTALAWALYLLGVLPGAVFFAAAFSEGASIGAGPFAAGWVIAFVWLGEVVGG